jgi:hypothetical protein
MTVIVAKSMIEAGILSDRKVELQRGKKLGPKLKEVKSINKNLLCEFKAQ